MVCSFSAGRLWEQFFANELKENSLKQLDLPLRMTCKEIGHPQSVASNNPPFSSLNKDSAPR